MCTESLEEGVSVILCCHNSERVIRKTLNSLANQELDGSFQCEVVFVDNNCTDNTIKIVNEFRARSNVELRIVEEKTLKQNASPFDLNRLALAYNGLGLYQKAKNIIDKAIKNSPGYGEAFILAQRYMKI